MQPYIFPYVGYFQLIHAADIFVFYDDVNFINRGWINRNRILVNGKDQLITVSCKDASQNRLIKDIEVADDAKATAKMLSTIQMAYKKAPYFNDVYPIIEQTLQTKENNTISALAISSVINVANYLGMKKVFKISSEHYDNRELKKGDRLIDICHIEGIADYVNAAGGKEIYDKKYYKDKEVNLSFLVPERYEYPQFGHTFVPWLSIIDILMFNDKEKVMTEILPLYNLE